jgi:mannose-6-phosphate isomerase-like protein (cupin superfamily)
MSTVASTEKNKTASEDISAASGESKKIKWEIAPEERVNEHLVRQQLKGTTSGIIRYYASKGARSMQTTMAGESYLWVVGGRLHVDVDGHSVVLNPGEALLIPAKKTQMITVDEDALYIAFITNG